MVVAITRKSTGTHICCFLVSMLLRMSNTTLLSFISFCDVSISSTCGCTLRSCYIRGSSRIRLIPFSACNYEFFNIHCIVLMEVKYTIIHDALEDKSCIVNLPHKNVLFYFTAMAYVHEPNNTSSTTLNAETKVISIYAVEEENKSIPMERYIIISSLSVVTFITDSFFDIALLFIGLMLSLILLKGHGITKNCCQKN
jgi:hypothetical protein